MDFSNMTNEILKVLSTWESKLTKLSEDTIMNKHNDQNRTI